MKPWTRILADWDDVRRMLDLHYNELDIEWIKRGKQKEFYGPSLGEVTLGYVWGPFGMIKSKADFTVELHHGRTWPRDGDAALKVPRRPIKRWYSVFVFCYNPQTFCTLESNDLPNDEGKFKTVEELLRWMCVD